MIRRLFVIGVLLIIVNWGDDTLSDVGIRRSYQAADLIRAADRGISIPSTSMIIMAEGSPSVVLGGSAASGSFQTNVTDYYAPEGAGDIYYSPEANDQPPPLPPKVMNRPDGWNPKAPTPTKQTEKDDGWINPKTGEVTTTTDSVRLPKKIVLPF